MADFGDWRVRHRRSFSRLSAASPRLKSGHPRLTREGGMDALSVDRAPTRDDPSQYHRRYRLIPDCGDTDSSAAPSAPSATPISHWTTIRFCNGCPGRAARSMSQGLRVLVLAGGVALSVFFSIRYFGWPIALPKACAYERARSAANVSALTVSALVVSALI